MHVCSFVPVSSALKRLVQTPVCKACLWTCVNMYIAGHLSATFVLHTANKACVFDLLHCTDKDACDPAHSRARNPLHRIAICLSL